MKRMLLVVLPLLLAGSGMTCLTGCVKVVSKAKHNRSFAIVLTNGIEFRQQVTAGPDLEATAEGELVLAPEAWEYLKRSQDDGADADGD